MTERGKVTAAGHSGPRGRVRDGTGAERGDERDSVRQRPSASLAREEWRSIAEILALSDRQLEIVQGVLDGLGEPALSEQLGISTCTVHSHLHRLYKKLEIKSRCELVVQVFLAYLSQR